jgi:hypothetical protein
LGAPLRLNAATGVTFNLSLKCHPVRPQYIGALPKLQYVRLQLPKRAELTKFINVQARAIADQRKSLKEMYEQLAELKQVNASTQSALREI